MIRKIYLLCLMLFLHGLCHAAAISHAATPTSGIQWQTWSNTAFDQAKAKHLKVFVFVKADWCHTCQLTKDITLHDNDVIKTINENFIPIKLDVDKDVSILRQYRIVTFPTFVILDANHTMMSQFSGYISPEKLVKKLEENLKKEK